MKLYFTTIKMEDREHLVLGGYNSISKIIGETSKYLLKDMKKSKLNEMKFKVSACDEIPTKEGIDYTDSENICTITITKPE